MFKHSKLYILVTLSRLDEGIYKITIKTIKQLMYINLFKLKDEKKTCFFIIVH
jgi:hypothetical protein